MDRCGFARFGKTCEVVNADLLPFASIALLLVELVVHGLPTFSINIGSCALPYIDEICYLVDSVLIVALKFLPQRAAALHAVSPREMVEPK